MSKKAEGNLYDINEYMFQIIGALLLVVAAVCALLNWVWFAWVALFCVGVIDLFIIYKLKMITVSKWIRKLTGPKVDNVILITLIVVCWWLKGEVVALWFLLGLLNNHLFEKE